MRFAQRRLYIRLSGMTNLTGATLKGAILSQTELNKAKTSSEASNNWII